MQTRRGPEFSVQSWGANSYGQLGHGGVEDRPVPGLCDAAALEDKAVRVVTGGGGHTAIITEDGEVFVCGQNHRGQLGLGHLTDISTLQRCLSLTQAVTNVTCGWDFTLFLTDSGRVLSCGSNAFGQLGIGQEPAYAAEVQIVQSLKAAVVSVAAGLRHSLAVTDSGSVYQWGIGLLSQAKRTLSPSPVPPHLSSVVPSLVPGLNQKMSRVVAAGSMHCVCLTEHGDLFLWGGNKHGQLLSSEPFLSSPTPVQRSLLGGETVLRVWSGWTHIVAQTETGRVFTWGRGNYGQLGRCASASQSSESQSTTEKQEVRLPAEVPALQGATQITCGSEHNLAILGGRLLSWGWNEHGTCGDGSHADVFQPQLLPALRPLLIGCGAGHSMAVCAAAAASDLALRWRRSSIFLPHCFYCCNPECREAVNLCTSC